MGLNIKNERITALVRELAQRTGTTQTGAIEEAVRYRLAQLDRDADASRSRRRDAKRARVQQLLTELHASVTEAERAEVKAGEQDLYDNAGLPA